MLRSMYALGSRLHKTMGELEDMPVDEFVHWLAFFSLESEDTKRGKS